MFVSTFDGKEENDEYFPLILAFKKN